MNGKHSTSCLFFFSFLAGCMPPAEQEVVAPQAPAAETAAPALPPEPATATVEPVFDTTTSLSELMNDLIQPNADTIWKAVSYVVTDEGVTETQPTTTEDWERLRTSALVLIEAGNALMLPGRPVAAPDASGEYPDFQYRPEEIEALIAADPASWNAIAQDLQGLTRDTLTAIGFRDLMGLNDFGARINEACQDCHAQFWYRPL